MGTKFDTPEDSFSSGNPIVLYLHGNSGSRAGSHRIELYKILQSLNYHVVTMDYRGIWSVFPKVPWPQYLQTFTILRLCRFHSGTYVRRRCHCWCNNSLQLHQETFEGRHDCCVGPFSWHWVSDQYSTQIWSQVKHPYIFLNRVASRTVGQLCSEKRSPDRLILEAPFNNIRDEIRNHPLSYVNNNI